MKNILITGANSYVGTSFEKWLSQWPDKYHVDTINMKDSEWREKSFKGYDVVFHVAGIAHRKETKQNAHEYYEINCDLAVETAKKAKNDCVPQFIFMSTMGVYGMLTGVVTKDTMPNPKTHYGKSKFQAEKLLMELASDNFKIVILRPPIVYGKNCTGNYAKLSAFAKTRLFFPNIKNKRSMIYIDNLSEYIREKIDNESEGICLPQNKEYISTSDMVRAIAEINHNEIHLTRLFNPIIRLLIGHIAIISKLFGDFIYLDTFDESENIKMIPTKETIRLSEQE